MPVRLYPTATVVDDVQPALDPSWEFSDPPVRRRRLAPYLEGYVSELFFGGAGVAADLDDACCVQYLTDPLPAQVIEGTVKAQFLCHRSGVGGDVVRSQMLVKIVTPAGATRAVLLPHQAGSLANAWQADDIGFENRSFPYNGPAALASAEVLAGDRIAVELGARAHGAQMIDQVTIWSVFLDNFGDLPEEGAGGYYDLQSWIEFSVDLFSTVRGAETMDTWAPLMRDHVSGVDDNDAPLRPIVLR